MWLFDPGRLEITIKQDVDCMFIMYIKVSSLSRGNSCSCILQKKNKNLLRQFFGSGCCLYLSIFHCREFFLFGFLSIFHLLGYLIPIDTT